MGIWIIEMIKQFGGFGATIAMMELRKNLQWMGAQWKLVTISILVLQ